MAEMIIRGATVFDGTGRAPWEQASVVVQDGRIHQVGGTVPPAAPDALEIDGTGQYLLPGFFDTHVHFAMEGPDLLGQLQLPVSYSILRVPRRLRATLDAGVTTVRDLGGTDRGVQMAQTEGLVAGPRLQIAVRMLSITGGHGDLSFPDSSVDFRTEAIGAVSDGPAAVLKAVRRVIHAGADVVKVATTGGVLSPRDDPAHSHFSPEELATMVAEASRQGRRLAAHAQGAEGIKNAVRAGFTSIEHGIYLDDEAIELMVDRGTFLVPTLAAPLAVMEAHEAGVPVPAWAVAKTRRVLEAHQGSVARAHRAGVKIALGTDSGVGPHGHNLKELAHMVSAGLSPMEAITAGTRNAAELMGLLDELGTLEVGKRADLVLTAVNPLTDIGNLGDPGRILLVVQDGKVVKDIRPRG